MGLPVTVKPVKQLKGSYGMPIRRFTRGRRKGTWYHRRGTPLVGDRFGPAPLFQIEQNGLGVRVIMEGCLRRKPVMDRQERHLRVSSKKWRRREWPNPHKKSMPMAARRCR